MSARIEAGCWNCRVPHLWHLVTNVPEPPFTFYPESLLGNQRFQFSVFFFPLELDLVVHVGNWSMATTTCICLKGMYFSDMVLGEWNHWARWSSCCHSWNPSAFITPSAISLDSLMRQALQTGWVTCKSVVEVPWLTQAGRSFGGSFICWLYDWFLLFSLFSFSLFPLYSSPDPQRYMRTQCQYVLSVSHFWKREGSEWGCKHQGFLLCSELEFNQYGIWHCSVSGNGAKEGRRRSCGWGWVSSSPQACRSIPLRFGVSHYLPKHSHNC